ncbi:MAG: hypothetical protein KJP18_04370, partial [Gemmatimonadetes bacterium]|nr:hypothetical protein [Gemmatimonadota bacterium]
MAPLEPVAACLACGSSDRDAHHETAAMMDASAQRFRFSRCRACGLVYLDPRVPAGDLGRYYTDAY